MSVRAESEDRSREPHYLRVSLANQIKADGLATLIEDYLTYLLPLANRRS